MNAQTQRYHEILHKNKRIILEIPFIVFSINTRCASARRESGSGRSCPCSRLSAFFGWNFSVKRRAPTVGPAIKTTHHKYSLEGWIMNTIKIKYAIAPIVLFSLSVLIPSISLSQPIGTIVAFGGEIDSNWEANNDWLKCDGRSLDRTQYNLLFKSIGTSWGSHSGSTFSLPNLQGLFLRGVNGPGVLIDPDAFNRTAGSIGGNSGNKVGSFQSDTIMIHNHDAIDNGHGHSLPMRRMNHAVSSGTIRVMRSMTGVTGTFTATGKADIKVSPKGGSETRPVNAYVFWIIKYK